MSHDEFGGHGPSTQFSVCLASIGNGVFLLIASRRPAENRSLIAFTAWSSLVQACIMTVQALQNTAEQGICSAIFRPWSWWESP